MLRKPLLEPQHFSVVVSVFRLSSILRNKLLVCVTFKVSNKEIMYV